jgi:hypothetical protein
MRIIFEAEVSGVTPLKTIIEMKQHPFIIRLIPNDKGMLEKICIEKQILNYEKFLPKFSIGPEKGSVAQMYIPEQDFLEEEKLIQHIESFGGLDLGIKKIHWETPRITWIPETQEEKVKVTMPTYKRSFQYEQPKTPISLGWLQEVVIRRNMTSHLAPTLSFFRIGADHYHSFKYSEAFLNFYLMLEGFFGNGQSKNHKVEVAFKNSDILKYAMSEAFDFLNSDNAGSPHKVWLESYVKEKGWSFDNDGLIKSIICIRGNLSHYYFKSSRKQRDCFNEKEHESIACIIMMVCLFATIKLRVVVLK